MVGAKRGEGRVLGMGGDRQLTALRNQLPTPRPSRTKRIQDLIKIPIQIIIPADGEILEEG